MTKKEEKKPWWKSVKKVLLVVFGVWFGLSLITGLVETAQFSRADKIAVVPITGAIAPSQGVFGQENVNPKDIVSQIESIREDQTVKAVILEINSPGGTVVASREIAQAVDSLPQPTIAWIREVGASGAYWIAASSDHIVADELSITGSIGVIGSYLQFEDLFEDYGITYERLVAGNSKDIGSPFKKLSRSERNLLQSKLDIIHDIFVEEVAENRNLTISETRKLADGSFYLGIEAKDLRLIDVLGGKEQAFDIAEDETGLEDYETVVYEKSKGFLGLLQGVSAHSFYFMGKGIGSAFVDDAKTQSGIPSFSI
tara:strand:- start:8546 stop:9484 length:939 start_codon:yes stop_codon:yes gene_type:complete